MAFATGLPAHAQAYQYDFDPPAQAWGVTNYPTAAARFLTMSAAEQSGGPRTESILAYPFDVLPSASRDWAGAAKDMAYFVGYQLAGVAILYAMPESISGWTDEKKKEYNFQTWRDNVSSAHWDEDNWFVNYVLHPYWGGAYYIRARERGLDRWQSLGYSFAMSFIWEYGAEALFERVSTQDLIFTPLLGAVLGEFVFSPLRESIHAKQAPLSLTDKFWMLFTDPLGGLNAEVDRAFGVKPSYSLAPAAMLGPAQAVEVNAARLGMSSSLAQVRPAWGLQFRVRW